MAVQTAFPFTGESRRYERRYPGRTWMPGRDLAGSVSPGRRGTCVWCGEPTAARKAWHPECDRTYLAARGRTAYVDKSGPLFLTESEARARWRRWRTWYDREQMAARREGRDIDQTGNPFHTDPILCVACGVEPYREVDHALALAIAAEHRLRGVRRWWRAWTVGNLRPLCAPCHAEKTRADRAEITRLRQPGTPLERPPVSQMTLPLL